MSARRRKSLCFSTHPLDFQKNYSSDIDNEYFQQVIFFEFFYFTKIPFVAYWIRITKDPAWGRLRGDSTMSRCRGGGSDLLYS